MTWANVRPGNFVTINDRYSFGAGMGVWRDRSFREQQCMMSETDVAVVLQPCQEAGQHWVLILVNGTVGWIGEGALKVVSE